MFKHYHLVGIGGIGMSGIAKLLLGCGIEVSGSDLKTNAVTQELGRLGAKIYSGHNAENIKGADCLVYSSAIKEDNPEFAEAKKRGIALLKRAEALAGLMQNKAAITVTGSHGKTTTTSLISCLLLEAGLSPTVAVGGILKNIDTNACLGSGRFFVAEADESDGSFLYYRPKYSIVTNIDREHLDYYKDFESELRAFEKFLNLTEKGGCVFGCADDPNITALLKNYQARYVLFGLRPNSGVHPENIIFSGLSSEFDSFYNGKGLGRFRLSLGGAHNISNAQAVIALGIELGIDIEVIRRALLNYRGAARRLEIKFNAGGITLLDDYAHHPTEIKATLEAARKLLPKRLIAIFQPHRYTRTKLLLDDFAASFAQADAVIVTDIYAASEPEIEGVSANALCERIKKHAGAKEVIFLQRDKIAAYALKMLRPQDLLITLGAGDIVKVSDELAEELKIKNQARGKAKR